jgi:hypothetical protein
MCPINNEARQIATTIDEPPYFGSNPPLYPPMFRRLDVLRGTFGSDGLQFGRISRERTGIAQRCLKWRHDYFASRNVHLGNGRKLYEIDNFTRRWSWPHDCPRWGQRAVAYFLELLSDAKRASAFDWHRVPTRRTPNLQIRSGRHPNLYRVEH